MDVKCPYCGGSGYRSDGDRLSTCGDCYGSGNRPISDTTPAG